MAEKGKEVAQQHKSGLPRAISNGDGQLVFEQLCEEWCEWSGSSWGNSDEHGTVIEISSGALSVEGFACPACSIFRAAVRHYEIYNNDGRYPAKRMLGKIKIKENRLELWHDPGYELYTMRCDYRIFTPLVSTTRTRMTVATQLHDNCHGNVAPRVLDRFRIHSPHAGSHRSVQLLKEWLQDCLNSHQSTCYHRETVLPDRVLDVGTHTLPLVRLWASGGGIGRYCALSHCWGSDERHRPMTTTRETLARREAGIDQETLPKTFRDAVTLARNLDVRYLWIDSLCIIQDDDQD